MHTLIELFDDRAIENVLGPEMFCPKKVIYLCPEDVIRDKGKQKTLREYFAFRGQEIQLEFLESSMYKTDKILKQLHRIADSHPDLAMDITGGTDAALFAAGMFCQETNIPVFTYSRKRNCFFDVKNAPFADGLICSISYTVEDFIRMAGGTLRKGRVDTAILGSYIKYFEPFFHLYLKHQKKWIHQITFIQKISQVPREEEIPLQAEGSFYQKKERGGMVSADPGFFQDLEKLGFIRELEIVPEKRIAFCFRDHQVRTWLRDVGSVLELYLYLACKEAEIFDDVVSSAIVDWDGTVSHDSVSNEIDAVAVRGQTPLFISCKACEVKTEAINELAILKDRFGGKGAKAAIATTEFCSAAARHRAAQMGIAVIDLEELESGRAADRLRVIMKVDEMLREKK